MMEVSWRILDHPHKKICAGQKCFYEGVKNSTEKTRKLFNNRVFCLSQSWLMHTVLTTNVRPSAFDYTNYIFHSKISSCSVNRNSRITKRDSTHESRGPSSTAQKKRIQLAVSTGNWGPIWKRQHTTTSYGNTPLVLMAHYKYLYA